MQLPNQIEQHSLLLQGNLAPFRYENVGLLRQSGLVAHQEVILGTTGQTLTLRHDTSSRDAFTPGVLLALEFLETLDPGVSHGLDKIFDAEVRD